MTPLELILSKIPNFGKCRACGAAHLLSSAAAAAKGVWGEMPPQPPSPYKKSAEGGQNL